MNPNSNSSDGKRPPAEWKMPAVLIAIFPNYSAISSAPFSDTQSFTGWVRIQLPDVIKTRRISILMGAKMQLLEVVTGHSQFLRHFSVPQAMPTQPVKSMQNQAPAGYFSVQHFASSVLENSTISQPVVARLNLDESLKRKTCTT